MIPPRWRPWWLFGCLVLLFGALIFGALTSPASAALRIPAKVNRLRGPLTSAARWEFGLNAPVAILGAQIEQESGGEEEAQSPVGAQGPAQIMPETAKWFVKVRPDLGPPDVWHGPWACRFLCAYNAWHLARSKGHTECDRWAKALAAYNGGLGWVQRDEAEAVRQGLDPLDWWDGVSRINAGRSQENWKQNRRYPDRILRVLAPRYVAAGWGAGVCP